MTRKHEKQNITGSTPQQVIATDRPSPPRSPRLQFLFVWLHQADPPSPFRPPLSVGRNIANLTPYYPHRKHARTIRRSENINPRTLYDTRYRYVLLSQHTALYSFHYGRRPLEISPLLLYTKALAIELSVQVQSSRFQLGIWPLKCFKARPNHLLHICSATVKKTPQLFASLIHKYFF